MKENNDRKLEALISRKPTRSMYIKRGLSDLIGELEEEDDETVQQDDQQRLRP